MPRSNVGEVIRVLREALQFYMDNWRETGWGLEPTEELLEDSGKRAEIALEHAESLGGPHG